MPLTLSDADVASLFALLDDCRFKEASAIHRLLIGVRARQTEASKEPADGKVAEMAAARDRLVKTGAV